MCEPNRPIFSELDADEAAENATEIESLCMNCHKNGKTRLLLTKIPHYKELVLMSFDCEHCGFENNEIQSGGAISEKGIKLTLRVANSADLNRRVVKSDYACVKIPEVDFEIPAQSQKGGISTVEGLIERAVSGLQQDQEERRKLHPEVAEQIEAFVGKLTDLKAVKEPFTVVITDISGNSFVENFHSPKVDPSCDTEHFQRTKEEDHLLGIFTNAEVNGAENVNNSAILQPINEEEFTYEDLKGEVLQFSTNCHRCSAPCETNMKVTKIPHFKEVVIMATVCDSCGHRTNEVKSGAGIEEKGLNIRIEVRGKVDFSRDVLKSETCSLKIPELELEVGPRALGGRFTTVEGLLVAVKEQLADQSQSHWAGDSQDKETKERYEKFFGDFDELLAGSRGFSVILDDPAGNSYVQSLCEEDGLDSRLKIEKYERSFEQNDELGLNDMRTENYS